MGALGGLLLVIVVGCLVWWLVSIIGPKEQPIGQIVQVVVIVIFILILLGMLFGHIPVPRIN